VNVKKSTSLIIFSTCGKSYPFQKKEIVKLSNRKQNGEFQISRKWGKPRFCISKKTKIDLISSCFLNINSAVMVEK